MTKTDIVKPIQFAKEMNIVPQIVYGWIREGKIPSHKCMCGHVYLLRNEVETFVQERKTKVS
jgi:predicted site-specific integrase-resolvase